MTMYMFTALFIALPGLLYQTAPVSALPDSVPGNRLQRKNGRLAFEVTLEDIHLFIVAALMIFLMANRGAFSADSANYRGIFRNTRHIRSISDFIGHSRIEIGYILINRIVSLFTKDYYWMQLADTLLIIPPVICLARKSSCAWLALLLYFIFGTYFQAFNVVRQMAAASVLYWGIEGIYSGETKKYFIATILAALIHKISVIMIPMYFILRLSKRKLKWWQYILIYVVLSSAIVTLASVFFEAQNIGFNKTLSGYGSSVSYLPLIFLAMEFYMYFRIRKSTELSSEDASIINISMAGSLMFCICFILSTQVSYAIRLVAYFLPFVMIGVPKLISMQKSKWDRLLITFGITLFALLYFALSYGEQEWISRW